MGQETWWFLLNKCFGIDELCVGALGWEKQGVCVWFSTVLLRHFLLNPCLLCYKAKWYSIDFEVANRFTLVEIS